MAYINPKFVPADKTSELEKRQNQFRALLLSNKKAPVDQGPYRQRAGFINQGGIEATNYEVQKRTNREAAALKAQQKAMEVQFNRVNVNLPPGSNPGQTGGANYAQAQGGPKGSFAAFLNAIGQHESSNNYNARNRDSGAMGRFQIMPGNLGGRGSGWDYEALGRDVSSQQFMANPQLQDAIARYKLQQYYNQYGARGAAVAWYAGPGALKYGSAALNRGQGAYSSINNYANAIMRRLGL